MVWSENTRRNTNGQLEVGGVSIEEIAREFGTPLYIYDEEMIRSRCRLFREQFRQAYRYGEIAYAGKAWLSTALLRILAQEGLSLDVVSAGELHVALASGFPAERISLHGNNKSREEIALAIDAGIKHIVVDNFDEIELLAELLSSHTTVVHVLLRVNPGIDVHTHDYRKTGIIDSKFGLSTQTGDAERAVGKILSIAAVQLDGYHSHIGSQIFEVEPFLESVDTLFSFASDMRDRYGVVPVELSPGGGFAIQQHASDQKPDLETLVARIGSACNQAADRYDFQDLTVTLEPGRSIVGQAGIAVYTLGATKAIAGIRTYVSVDGGMADNIRPALYGAVYSAELVARPSVEPTIPVTIAGKYCESGDVLIDQIDLPQFQRGDLLAIPASGAYCLPMASNYNMALRPPVVFAADGEYRLVQRRETLNDLLVRDI